MNEENMDLLSRIRTLHNQFTRAEKKVAGYVLEHAHEILFMSITELSDACEVGETSVFRFCRTIKLEGYQEFKMQLSLSLQHGSPPDSSGMLSADVAMEDDLNTLVRKVLQTHHNALNDTAKMLSLESLSRAVNLMSNAHQIVFFGVGASLITALKASDKFRRIEPKVTCVNDAHAQAMVAATMTASDVAVVISYSGATKDTNIVAKLAKARGAKVIALTRYQKSPLTEFTDVALLCGANEKPLEGGSSCADVSETFLLDLLYTEYYRRNYEKCSENNELTTASVLAKLY